MVVFAMALGLHVCVYDSSGFVQSLQPRIPELELKLMILSRPYAIAHTLKCGLKQEAAGKDGASDCEISANERPWIRSVNILN
jgi:hypothetical protein